MSSTIISKIGDDSPLVSVVVITYNSKEYVIETLESIKQQSYQNIELVISDDCSTDDTVEICREWLKLNSDKFTNSILVVAPINTGIPGNCNQGLSSANGEWVKFIAGDDILLPECISIFYEASCLHTDIECFVSQQYVMSEDVIDQVVIPIAKLFPPDASKQLKHLLKYGSVPAPATFFSKNVLVAVDGFDNNYRGVEDYPLYIRLTNAGYFFHIIQKPTVIYRYHQQSISNSKDSPLLSNMQRHFDEVVRPLIKEKKLYMLSWHYLLKDKYIKSSGLKKIFISWTIRLTDTIYWLQKIFLYISIDNQLLVYRKSIKPFSIKKITNL